MKKKFESLQGESVDVLALKSDYKETDSKSRSG